MIWKNGWELRSEEYECVSKVAVVGDRKTPYKIKKKSIRKPELEGGRMNERTGVCEGEM